MDYPNQENIWMVCLNCDYVYNMDEFFADDYYGSCPLCESHSCRETTTLDEQCHAFDEYIEYIDDTYDDE